MNPWRRASLPLRRALGAARARLDDRRHRGTVEHELAVCAIFREEAPFLTEWLAFHRGVGVGHFYLYDNFSTDDFRAVLAPWIADGLVTLKDWPVPVGQLAAYEDCLRVARRTCRWLAFIDIDEFLFAPGRGDIRPLLRERRHLSGIEVYQAFFGSNGLQARPAGPLIEAFTMRAPLEVQTSAKSIVNPRLVRRAGVHQCTYWAGVARDPDGQPVTRGSIGSLDGLRINHYWSRSLDDLATKIARGDASTADGRNAEAHYAYEKTLTGVEDRVILGVGTLEPLWIAGTFNAASADGPRTQLAQSRLQ